MQLRGRWYRLSFLGIVLFGNLLFADDFFECCSSKNFYKPIDADWDFGAGYRQGELRWSIAGPDGDPNVLSELVWERLRVVNYELRGEYNIWKHYIVKMEGDYGQIHSGYNRDSDYLGNDKTFLFLRSENNAGKGKIFDVFGAIGYRFYFSHNGYCIPSFQGTLTPFIGAYRSEEHVRMFQGHLTFPIKQKIQHLHSRYWARWYGAWAGLDASFVIMKDWDFYCSAQVMRCTYHGTGHWNLRPEFIKDFQDHAQGVGVRYMVGSTINLMKFYVGAIGYYQHYSATNGKQYTYLDILGYNNPVVSKLNKVIWYSSWLTLIIGYHF